MSVHGEALLELLKRGDSLLMDGALGTELERHALPIEGEGWSALAVRDHAEVISAIHGQYLDAGARLHIVNSFALARHVLEPIGLGAEFERLNRRSVALFEDAVSAAGADRKNLWAAGSLSTFAANSDRRLLPKSEVLWQNCHDQAALLADAGVDLFALEMLFDVDVSRCMLDAVSGFGLPVIAGFTCEWEPGRPGSVVTHSGVGFAPVPLQSVLAQALVDVDPNRVVLAIMHSDVDVTEAALDIARQHWPGVLAAYPNSGEFVDLHLQFDSVCSEDAFERAALGWIESGVQIVGGCCGVGPTHIDRLGGKLDWS